MTRNAKSIIVLVCGDDVCELEENCLNCPADCGICPMSIAIKVAIGLPVALFSSGFVLTMVVSLRLTHSPQHTNTNRRECFHVWIFIFTCQWLQYQKQKMFWDESWIINYKNIIFGKNESRQIYTNTIM